jgi:periplasmic divalent cation tolerance protein
MAETYCMALCTSPDPAHAHELAHALVERRLAACVQIMPVKSVYTWEGRVTEDEEQLMFIKTRSSLFGDVSEFIRDNHPYEVPEVIRVDISGGLESYLDWIAGVTG